MVADEADRRDHEVAVSLAGQPREHLAGVGTEPGAAGSAGALIGKLPGRESQFARHCRGTRPQLVRIGVTGRENASRQAVGGENNIHGAGVGEAPQGLREVRRYHAQEQRVVAPAPDQRDLEPPRSPPSGRFEERLLVRADGHPGIVRRHHDRDEPPIVIGHDLLDRVHDVRVPVPHPDVDRDANLAGEGRALRLGDREDRRAAADHLVAVSDLGDQLRAGGPPAAHVQEVGLHIGEGARAPIGHQQHRELSHREPAPPPPAPPRPASPAAHRGPG